MKSKYLLIRYIVKYVQHGGISTAKFRTKKINNKKVQRFMNCHHKLARIDKCAEMLLRFLTEEMDDVNCIIHTKVLRQKFIGHMAEDCQLNYADATVKKALASLVLNNLIIKSSTQMEYIVNPLHYYTGDEKGRKALIQRLIYDDIQSPDSKSNIRSAIGF